MAVLGLIAVVAPAGAQAERNRENDHGTGTSHQELSDRLATLVDLPRAIERRTMARALAKDELATVDEWLAACRAFAPIPDPDLSSPGVHELEVDLGEVDGRPMRGTVTLCVPRNLRAPTPLCVAMHGTGGHGSHMVGMWRALCEAHGVLLLCPTEPGPNEGFAATDAEREAVLAAVRWVRRRFDVDENAVFLTGFSRGGHLTWDLGLRHPDRWAALAPMCGGPRFELARGAANMRYLENVLHVPLVDLQGALDQEGLVWSVREAFRRLEALDAKNARLVLHERLGHSVDMQQVDWAHFFTQRRTAAPEGFVRLHARASEGRTAWLECITAKKDVQEEFRPSLKESEHAALDAEGLRRFLIEAADERTGRVAARITGPATFELDATGVTKVRLVLTDELLGFDGSDRKAWPLQVRTGPRTQTLRARRDTRVLLEEFAERFDRRFLPTASVEVTVGR
jgi:predicted esterase